MFDLIDVGYGYVRSGALVLMQFECSVLVICGVKAVQHHVFMLYADITNTLLINTLFFN